MNNPDFKQLVMHGQEERWLEYKPPADWHDMKHHVVRCCLAMANKRNGGFLIIGLKERDNRFEQIGLTDEQSATYNADEIRDHVNSYAEPYVELDADTPSVDGKTYVGIKIYEFSETPVICKKVLEKGGKPWVHPGQMLSRTLGVRPRSAPVTRAADIREIIDHSLIKAASRCKSIEAVTLETQKDESDFDDQLGGL